VLTQGWMHWCLSKQQKEIAVHNYKQYTCIKRGQQWQQHWQQQQ